MWYGNFSPDTELIDLAARDMHHEPFADVFDVSNVKGNQFGTPQRSCEAEQQQRTVSQPLQATQLRQYWKQCGRRDEIVVNRPE